MVPNSNDLFKHAGSICTSHPLAPVLEKFSRRNNQINQSTSTKDDEASGGHNKNAFGSQSFNGHKLSCHQSQAFLPELFVKHNNQLKLCY